MNVAIDLSCLLELAYRLPSVLFLSSVVLYREQRTPSVQVKLELSYLVGLKKSSVTFRKKQIPQSLSYKLKV